ncbi:hypothetical protein SLEP1_g35451 [Rubroshorea leprosula]|uniref:Leucine-rich repeat-containing N-terminal plant-type domain-containing protein n=1 Tax=Rubroshorea leprosula TaxID=152421 RepID=A0AAV5KNF5_9ROSI|nr:hypothetical protein SLEP1_g35451 [Rubroshorea leprosula]
MATSSSTHFFLLSLVFLVISFFQLSSHQQLCLKDEYLALMQFKDSFVIERQASTYPKIDLWKSQGVDCCSWEGIWCDQNTFHVIGLDLSSSCLFGSINSSSSLFHLRHLQYLNLALNDFNFSKIPSAMGNLSKLTYLNLSRSFFAGQIPQGISKLSKLVELDLSFNLNYLHQGLLELKKPDWNSLAQNLTRLEWLDLSLVGINSPIPKALVNMSSLTYLHLGHCGLLGKFSRDIFQLPKLQVLDLVNNWELSGSFPKFHSHNQLRVLDVGNTTFSGELPVSIGMLSSLEYLDVRSCDFSSLVPPSIGNLTKLQVLILLNNSFYGEDFSFFSNLTQLTKVFLTLNHFTFNEVPSSFANLIHLKSLNLFGNQITGHFPSWITNLTDLRYLDLGYNMLQGSLPSSISRLKNLETFIVSYNNLSGIVEFDTFLELKSLKSLGLSHNNFSLVIKATTNRTIQKFKGLGLASCNLNEFPEFLQNQSELNVLVLASNNIHGQIPSWIMNMSASLWILDLSHNNFTSFEESFVVFPSTSLLYLVLSFNFLRGPLPIPPPSILYYLVSRNMFSGKIPSQFCKMTSLQVLDLSHNNLSGMIPQCFGKLSSMLVLNLEGNNFDGPMPETWESGNKLKAIKMGQNILQGRLPRSLSNCKMLEFLDLGNNKIKDTFPSWLGALPKLRILILHSNRLYGTISIKVPKTDFLFPKLRIIDLSDNGFVGTLPIDFLVRWNAITDLDGQNATYLRAYNHYFMLNLIIIPYQFPYSMTITNKGRKMEYAKILEVFSAMDLSSNKFEGEIPEVIGNLKGLQLLNLSNNILVGPIPRTLGYLTNLEALDLSQNRLTGRIPTQLTRLNFLEVFNVSHNHLTGPIPQGQQFDTFENDSFDGNSGLCGMPLSRKCDCCNSKDLPPPSSTSKGNEDSGLLAKFSWKLVLLGYGCGFLIGIVIGNIAFTRKHEWFMKTFRISYPRRQREGCERLNKRKQRR